MMLLCPVSSLPLNQDKKDALFTLSERRRKETKANQKREVERQKPEEKNKKGILKKEGNLFLWHDSQEDYTSRSCCFGCLFLLDSQSLLQSSSQTMTQTPLPVFTCDLNTRVKIPASLTAFIPSSLFLVVILSSFISSSSRTRLFHQSQGE
jgi:hypothetical protein